LTIICRQQPSLRWDIGDSRGTVALRVPAHDDAIELLLDNGPLAVSSANTTGMPPATTIEEAQEMLGETVDVYLDAGPTAGQVPSTMVDATGDVLRVVRIGVITLEQLREVVPSIEGPDDVVQPEVFEGFASPADDESDGVDLGYDEQDVTDHAGGQEPADDDSDDVDLGYDEQDVADHAGGQAPRGGQEQAHDEFDDVDLGLDEQDVADHAGGQEPGGGQEPADVDSDGVDLGYDEQDVADHAGGQEPGSADPAELPPRPD
jgi:hypothetical protein